MKIELSNEEAGIVWALLQERAMRIQALLKKIADGNKAEAARSAPDSGEKQP